MNPPEGREAFELVSVTSLGEQAEHILRKVLRPLV